MIKTQMSQKRGSGECPASAIRKRCFATYRPIKKTDELYILMVEGKYLDHPKLEKGARTRTKIFRVNPRKDLPIKTITNILKTALDLYRKGVIRVQE